MAFQPELRYHYIRPTLGNLQRIAARLRELAPPGVTEIIPSYKNIMVEYQPARISLAKLQRLVDTAQQEAISSPAQGGRMVEVPVRYDGEDLPMLSEQLGLSTDGIVQLHSGREYHVSALGFTPGFPFLGEVDERLRMPRRGVPRPTVPANTVAMADFQTGIYPSATPGGWHLLGQSLTAVYDPHRADPFLIHPGDRVRFVPADGPTPPMPTPLSLLPADPEFPILRVEETGLLDIMVDSGRFGMAHFGLARSGPHDPIAADIANRLLGNAPGATVLEMHVHGPRFTVLTSAVLASAGIGYTLTVNNCAIQPNSSLAVAAGDEVVLSFSGGQIAYLAVNGGFQSNQFAGSASVDLNGLIGQQLQQGDVLGAASPRFVRPGRIFSPHRWLPRIVHVPIVPGPQCNPAAIQALTTKPYQVTSRNRMGITLTGDPVPGGQIPSEGNPVGAIQITTAGKPIVLLQDRGTVGGYSKPALIPSLNIRQLSSVLPGGMIQFYPDRRAFSAQYIK